MATISKRTGLLLSVIFVTGVLIELWKITFIQNAGFGRAVTHPYVLIMVIMAGLSVISAYSARLSWIQPAIFLGGTAEGVLSAPESYYGLGFFVIAVLLLFRLGFFLEKKIVKLSLALLYLFALEVISNLRMGLNLVQAFTPIFFILALLLMLYLAYEEKLMVYLKEPKPKISLAEKGFTPLEAKYIFAIIEGKTPKEIAFDMKVTESTARNNISRSFHKLGVDDRHEFTIYSLKNDIVD